MGRPERNVVCCAVPVRGGARSGREGSLLGVGVSDYVDGHAADRRPVGDGVVLGEAKGMLLLVPWLPGDGFLVVGSAPFFVYCRSLCSGKKSPRAGVWGW